MTGRIGWTERWHTAETGLALQSCLLCITFLAAEVTPKPGGLKQAVIYSLSEFRIWKQPTCVVLD